MPVKQFEDGHNTVPVSIAGTRISLYICIAEAELLYIGLYTVS